METISISRLKAHLSAEIKRVKRGLRLVVVDHRQPVAVLAPLETEALFARSAAGSYKLKKMTPLMKVDPLDKLAQERAERW